MKYFDTHSHLNGQWYKSDILEDLAFAKSLGVTKILLPGTCKEDSLKAIAMAKEFDGLYAAAGIHPCDAFTGKEVDFLKQINPNEIIAIGETGIDFYHKDSNPPLDKQLISFKKHIEYAIKWNKTLIIHAREAESQVYEVIKNIKNLRFIMHCYTGSWEWARKFIELGGYISIAGAITYAKTPTIEEVAKNTPLDKLIVETDAPFLTPVPHRGKNNKPEYVVYTAKHVASIREESEEVVLKALYENALKIFNIKE